VAADIAATEAMERYQALASLVQAAGSQIGANGYVTIGSVLFMNAETIAAEITDHSVQNPQLALAVDFIVNAFLQMTTEKALPDGLSPEGHEGP
jgi:hypothetical protein